MSADQFKGRCAYLAHPVSGNVQDNLASIGRWLSYFKKVAPDYIVCSPYLGALVLGIERDDIPEQRARGLLECQRIAARFDGIILCGGRISLGMELELEAVVLAGGWVCDLTSVGKEPPLELWSPVEYGRLQWQARAQSNELTGDAAKGAA
jgi:hypothetical protein